MKSRLTVVSAPRAGRFSFCLASMSLGLAVAGCHGPAPKTAAAGAQSTHANATCSALGSDVSRFAEVLEELGESGKPRRGSYAGVLETLLTFEHASKALSTQIAALGSDERDPNMADLLKRTAAVLDDATEFAKVERDRIEKSALELGPPAKDADAAYTDLRVICDGSKKAPRECAGVNDAMKKLDAGTFAEQSKAADDLAALTLKMPKLASARDRAVAATRALGKSVEAQSSGMKALAVRWATTEKSVSAAFTKFNEECKGTPTIEGEKFVAEPRPDPRKLTVLVRVKPPAGIDETFEALASRAKNPEERAFYQGRARGAFGSGFVVVRRLPGGATETLIITNRHVVELADRADLELADGTALGPADIIFTDSVQDIAILRPTKKLPIEKGFSFADVGAKDQQGVVATGFPGMAGRPSYQTTRGYVSNESFKLEESSRPLTFVQHTAPIDPGSSGGPLTDEGGHVLGINTLKVTNREAVGLAVPSTSILEALHRSDAAELRRASAAQRREAARLACLGFVAELASKKPRMLVMENMISNNLTSSEGLAAAMAIDDEGFGQLWQNDSVRAMRIATLLRVQSMVGLSGGTNALEMCNDVNAEDTANILTTDEVRYKIRLGNWDSREVAFRWEQGHYKLARVDLRAPKLAGVAPAPPDKKPAAKPKKKKK